jgi:DNA repair protein RadC
MNPSFTFPGLVENPIKVIQGSAAAAQLFSYLCREEQEVVAAAYLDSAHGVIAVREIFRGTVLEATAQPREILREGLRVNAARFLVAHNHVSTNTLPSAEDVRFTVRMEWAADAVGLPLLDHLIIARDATYFSFAEAKLLRKSSGPWRKRSFRSPGNPGRYC